MTSTPRHKKIVLFFAHIPIRDRKTIKFSMHDIAIKKDDQPTDVVIKKSPNNGKVLLSYK